MIVLLGEKQFIPPTYKLIWGTEVKGWWIFKRYVEVGYIHSSEGMTWGPFYEREEAIYRLYQLKGLIK